MMFPECKNSSCMWNLGSNHIEGYAYLGNTCTHSSGSKAYSECKDKVLESRRIEMQPTPCPLCNCFEPEVHNCQESAQRRLKSLTGKTLHLVLKRKWFDMILSGEKVEEYRELSDHWCKRLLEKNSMDPKYFDTITFSHGYAKDRDQFVINYLDLEINSGLEEWGAVEGKRYFVLKLGLIIR